MTTLCFIDYLKLVHVQSSTFTYVINGSNIDWIHLNRLFFHIQAKNIFREQSSFLDICTSKTPI